MHQADEDAEQQKQTQLQKAVVTERMAGLRARQEHLRAALEQADAAVSAAAAARPSTAATPVAAARHNAAAAQQQRKAAAAKAAALLVEDDGLDDELNVGKGARRNGASAGGFVETERDRLIRTVRDRQSSDCMIGSVPGLDTSSQSPDFRPRFRYGFAMP